MKIQFVPSKYQQAIYDFITGGTGNAVVSAVAGSGKTTTLLNAIKLIPADKRTLFSAFNKSIAKELEQKVPNTPNISVKTVHGFGMSILNKEFSGIKVLAGKYTILLRKIFEFLATGNIEITKSYDFVRESQMNMIEAMRFDEVEEKNIQNKTGYLKRVVDLCDLGRLNLIDMNNVDKGVEMLTDIAKKHNIEIVNGECFRAWHLIKLGTYVINQVDYTDMIYFPIAYKMQIPQHDFVFIDECQDLNSCQRELMMKAVKPNGGRFIAVGDECQPSGTLVSVVIKKADRWNKAIIVKKKIEDLKVGDKVISADFRSTAFIYGRNITGISKRRYNDELVTATLESGKSSRYTVNHHCIATFNNLRDKWCVYVMRKGNYFRIGRSKMDYGRVGSGVFVRTQAEKADAMWILDTYDTKDECVLMEKAIAGKYGIPEMTFECSSNVAKFTTEFLNKAWAYLSTENLVERATKCLSDFGRRIEYPFYSKMNLMHGKNYHSVKRPMVVHACNLLDGCSMMPFNRSNGRGHFKNSEWEKISVKREIYSGNVYSLSVEKEHLYVADDILTHNCQAIYGFAGADADSFKKLCDIPNTITLPLSVSYRCGTSIIAKAQTIVPYIEACDTAKEGVIADDFSHLDIRSGDMVLCRNTFPLVSLCLKYLSMGIKSFVMGSDIGRSLAKMIEDTQRKTEAWTMENVFSRLYKEKEKIVALIMRKENLTQAEAEESSTVALYNDKIQVIELLASGITEPQLVIEKIKGIFSDDNNEGICLSTIHKSKGLEADRVFIIHEELMPSKFAKKDWEKQQERNLMYVAYTRAKSMLGFVTDFNAWKDHESQAGNAKEVKESKYVGAIGEKAPLELEVITVKEIQDTAWGTSTLFEMIDTEGNLFSKFGTIADRFIVSNHDEVKEGTKVRFSATVKAHKEYRGIKTTVLSTLAKYSK